MNTQRRSFRRPQHKEFIMWDIYLGGMCNDSKWKSDLKNKISKDIKIYDPQLDDYKKLNPEQKTNQMAKEVQVQQNCAIVIFYMNSGWKGTSTLLELGTAVGSGKQVIVCMDGKVKGSKQIEKYCEYHGINVCNSIDDLVLTIEEFIGELSILGSDA